MAVDITTVGTRLILGEWDEKGLESAWNMIPWIPNDPLQDHDPNDPLQDHDPNDPLQDHDPNDPLQDH